MYEPRKGSAAEAALEFIRKQGGSARSKEIAQEIGVEAKSISAILSAAVDNGVLVACDVAVPGTPTQKEYRLSAGGKAAPFVIRRAVLPPRALVTEAASPVHPRGESRRKVAGGMRVMHKTASKVHNETAKRPHTLSPDPSPAEGRGEKSAFRCGLFSSGHLEMVLRDGNRVELPPEDTRELCAYLDKTLQEAA